MRIERHAAVPDDDRATILAFWVRAWTPVVPTIDFAARRDWLSGHLDALTGAGAALLVGRTAAGRAVAFLTVDPATGAIDQLAVDPDVAGRGFASALMAEAKRLSPAGLTLRVNQINERAIRFYRHAEFAITGEAVGVRSGLPIWIMAWPGPGSA